MQNDTYADSPLRREREQHGWTQEEFAQQIGCDSKTVGRWERGESFPNHYYRRKLMKIYGKNAEELGLLKGLSINGSESKRLPTHKKKSSSIEDTSWQEDWGEAPHLDSFYGHEKELAQVEQWIVKDHCRLVAVLGIGGIGKTAFATRIARNIQGSFEYVFWRSLQNAPSIEYIVESCLRLLSAQQQHLPQSLDKRISLLITFLRKHRCLIVLDNVESILQAGHRAGLYQEHHEGYGTFFRRLEETSHQSCLLLTSREKPKEVAYMEGNSISPVRSLSLSGLELTDGQQLLQDKALFGTQEHWKELMYLYSGNPLALKILSEPIREVFRGDIAGFLKEHGTIIGDLQMLLDQQFSRLSALEQDIMYWLAVEREEVSMTEIQSNIVHALSKGEQLDAFDSLIRRFMIEVRSNRQCTLQPVIMEYVTEKFIEQVYQEIDVEQVQLLGSHALIKAQAYDYIRDSQTLFILAPLAEKLLAKYEDAELEKKFRTILAELRGTSSRKRNYAAGNILNLSIYLQLNLRSEDFSHLNVQQAYLQGVSLPEVNFAYARFANSVFTETFTSLLCVALSSDGNILAVGTTTGEVLLKQATNLMPLYTCLGHTDGIRSIAFSADGRILVSGCEDQTIRLWDVSTGKCLHILHGHHGYVRSVTFAGNILASAGDDQIIRLWDIQTGQGLHMLSGHTKSIRSITVHLPGNILASAGDDQIIRLWDIQTGQGLCILSGHTNSVRSITFSSAGDLLISGSEDHTVRLWSISERECLVVLQGHTARIRAVCFSPDERFFASASDDNTIRLWDTSTKQCLRVWQAHTNRIWSIAFFPIGNLLVSASEDETLRYWEVRSGRCLRTLQGYTSLIKAVAFRSDGQMVASGNEDHRVRLWDVKTGQCLHTLQGHANRVRAIAFSPNGFYLASGSEDETVRIWNTQTGQCIHILHGHTHLVRAVAFNSDGNVLISGSHDQTIRIWEVSTGHCIGVLQEQEVIWSVAFSFDNRYIASTSEDQNVHIWDAHTVQHLYPLMGHTERVWSVALSPTSYVVASGSDDSTIRIWDASTGLHLKTLHGHTHGVRSVTVSPSGSLIASGSTDSTLRIWDINTGECLKILYGHSSCVWSVAFSLDENFVVSGSDDGTTKLWDIQKGECIKTFRESRPYEQMNITNVKGLTEAQKAALITLGAIENSRV